MFRRPFRHPLPRPERERRAPVSRSGRPSLDGGGSLRARGALRRRRIFRESGHGRSGHVERRMTMRRSDRAPGIFRIGRHVIGPTPFSEGPRRFRSARIRPTRPCLHAVTVTAIRPVRGVPAGRNRHPRPQGRFSPSGILSVCLRVRRLLTPPCSESGLSKSPGRWHWKNRRTEQRHFSHSGLLVPSRQHRQTGLFRY